jgi:phage terminase large subunit-like protein
VSTIWIGGTDSKERVEKILGLQFSTIFIEEASQVPYEAQTKLATRLREKSGMSRRMIYAMNPCGTQHWTHQMFIKGLLPTGEPWLKKHASLLMNPNDNLINLDQEYIEELEALPKRERERFLLGKWLSDIEGALWTDTDIVNAKSKHFNWLMLDDDKQARIARTVVAVDPSVSNTSGSDECGIIVCSMDDNGDGWVEADYSGKMSTRAWAAEVVKAHWEFRANEVVIESNQGGDLCVDAIKNVPGGRDCKVVKVHASKGKQARAEPVQCLYEQGRIAHRPDLTELEDELTNWVPRGTVASPNRLDALVWGLTHLMVRNTRKRRWIGAV